MNISRQIAAMTALMLSTGGALSATLFTEDFEAPVAPDDGTVATYSKGTIPTGWVKSTDGYGSGDVGLNSIGTTQVISFRYTNSGLTSGENQIGLLKGNSVYMITFAVAEDEKDVTAGNELAYAFGLVVFDVGGSRVHVQSLSDEVAGLLTSKSGNAAAGGTWQTNSIVYTSSYANASAYVGLDLAVRLDGATTCANYDNITVETLSEDTTAPTIAPAEIVASASSVVTWSNYTYTLTFDDWIPAHLIDASSLTNVAASPATFSIVSVSNVDSNVIALTLMSTNSGNLQLQVTTNLVDAGLNNLSAAVSDIETISVADELIPPTVTSIVDNANSGPVLESSIVTYTVYFSEPVDSNQVTAAIFEDGGTSGASIDTVTALPAGIYESYAPSYEVVVTAGSAGTMILQIKAGATIQDRAGNNLDTTLAVPDATTINVVAPVTQAGTWIADQNGLWGHSPNWQGSNVAYGAGSTATFPNNLTATRTVTLDRDITIGGIDFQETGQDLIISGSQTLTLDAAPPTVHVPQSGRYLKISSAVAGTAGITKTGSGELWLTGVNTFTGGLIIDAGAVGDNNGKLETSSLNNNHITVNGNVEVVCQGGFTSTGGITLVGSSVLSIGSNNSSESFDGPVTGTGGIRLIRIGDGRNELNLRSSANTFTGGVEFNGVRKMQLDLSSFADSASPGAGNIRFTATRAAFDHIFSLEADFASSLTLNNRQFELAGPITATHSVIIDNDSPHAFTINTDLLVTGTDDGPLQLGGTGSGTNTFAGSITNGSSAVKLTKADSGKWILSGQNTYTGITTVNGGTLVLEGEESIIDTGTLNITAGTVEVNTREAIAVLQINGTPVASGIWGTTASGAPNINDVNLSGTGKLYVGVPFPPAGTVFMFK